MKALCFDRFCDFISTRRSHCPSRRATVTPSHCWLPATTELQREMAHMSLFHLVWCLNRVVYYPFYWFAFLFVSSPGSCWWIIIIDSNLHKDLWDFIITVFEKEKELSGFQRGGGDQTAPRGSNMSFYLTGSKLQLLRTPLHQSSHPSHQYECKSCNLVRLCGLWLSSIDCAKWCSERSLAH